MVVVTNSGEQYFMTKTDQYNRSEATKGLIKISHSCDHDHDGRLTRQEAMQAAKEFAKISYNYGIRFD